MRIGIDARFYGPRVGGGGIGRYVAELVTNLQKLDQENEYVIFLKKENFHECVITNHRFEKRLVDVHWYTIAEQTTMPGEIKRARVDFMHYPHWNIPIFSKVPFLVTIHDLILLDDPKSARSTTRGALVHGFKYAGFRTVLESAIHRSRHIVTVSEYTKESILHHFGIKTEKITVVPNGVNQPIDARDVSLTELGVYEPYFLYVGNAYPHKNLEMMLHTFARYLETHPYTQLVIAGRRDVFSHRLEREANEIGLPIGSIRFIDLPTDHELSELYRHTNLFIFPSRLEGFGIPPLEAMSYGTPVAAAEASSLPEILGAGANWFAPDDTEALEAIMIQATDDPSSLKSKSEQALKIASTYSWQNAARKTLDLYQRFPSL